jgi:hypothetical protein
MVLIPPRKNAKVWKAAAHRHRILVLTLSFVAVLLTLPTGGAWQKEPRIGSMPGMDMGDTADMGNMGPSMAAMAGHMAITGLRPKLPGDEDKAKAVIAAAKATVARYKDYRKALADGYFIANPKVVQFQYHFMNEANERAADTQFDPSKPSALLYVKTPHQDFTLEGVMYTASRIATEDELNQRIPLSMARWHEHINFCAAPANRERDYFGAHPKFGMFGSIRTKEACEAENGKFSPFAFTWMIHVFPYEKNFKDVFSMNDDAAHVSVRN